MIESCACAFAQRRKGKRDRLTAHQPTITPKPSQHAVCQLCAQSRSLGTVGLLLKNLDVGPHRALDMTISLVERPHPRHSNRES